MKTQIDLAIEPAEQVVQGTAAVIRSPGVVQLTQLRFTPPGEQQVRVRLQGCGICGSNLPVWEGRPWFEYPREAGSPGHEGWGIIDAIGPGVTRVGVGTRVAILSFHAFAEYDYAAEDEIVSLPKSLDAPFPGEAVGCAVNVFRRCSIKRGERVAVVGSGFLGALLIQLAAASEAQVTAFSSRPWALDLAKQCGAASCQLLDTSRSELSGNRVTDINRYAEQFDCVIEAAGFQGTLDLASRLVKTRGRLIIAGFHQDGRRTIDLQSWNWRGIDVINAHEREPAMYRDGVREAVSLIEQGRLDLSPLMTHELSLAELGVALELARTRPAGFLKAWVRCSGGDRSK